MHLLAAAVLAAEAQQAKNPILPATNEIIWGSLAFVVLLIGMWKFAFPAVTKMMNASTNPKSASASVNAMPRNMVVRTMPADSGWRAIDEMALPTTRPMPMPGPMAAPP